MEDKHLPDLLVCQQLSLSSSCSFVKLDIDLSYLNMSEDLQMSVSCCRPLSYV